jgi:hypothetical protein
MLVINNEFEPGELVYLKTDEDQKQRMVTKITIGLDDSLIYQLSCGTLYSDHYEKEISEERDVLKSAQ